MTNNTTAVTEGVDPTIPEGSSPRRIWVVNELFYPEETTAGHILTTIAAGLAGDHDVRAVCSQPTYSMRGTVSPRRERHRGIDIRRVRSTALPNESMINRLTNMVTFSGSTFARLLASLRRGDEVLVGTNPPLLPFLAQLAATIRRSTTTVIVHDMYPEVLEVASPPGRLTAVPVRILHALSRWLYRSCDSIVVIGPDQADRLVAKVGDSLADKIHSIPLSHDTALSRVIPKEESEFWRLQVKPLAGDDCVFQFAGNIGPLQGVDFLLDTVAEGRVPDTHFCFVGSGRSKSMVEQRLAESGLANASLFDGVPRSEAPDLHAGCDVIIVSLAEGMWGVAVPSRIGNALAAGRPILAVTDEGSSLDRIIKEYGVGWSVRPGDADGFWEAVAEASGSPRVLADKSFRARSLADSEYSEDLMIDRYRELYR